MTRRKKAARINRYNPNDPSYTDVHYGKPLPLVPQEPKRKVLGRLTIFNQAMWIKMLQGARTRRAG